MPSGLDVKFDKNGEPLMFSGNTILFHLGSSTLSSKLHLLMCDLSKYNHDKKLFTLLPEASFHITLFDCACKKDQDSWYWPENLANNISLAKCTDYIASKIIASGISLPNVKFVVSGFKSSFINTLGIKMSPSNHQDEEALNRFRDAISCAIGMRRDNHEAYAFHITIGYFIARPDEADRVWLTQVFERFIASIDCEVDTAVPRGAELCEFDNMCEFLPVMYF